MKRMLLIVMLAICLVLLPSCQKGDSNVSVPENTDDEMNKDTADEDVGDGEDDDAGKEISPLDGLKYYPDELERRPVVISIDNHPGARQQAGLSQAEIIYECEVENPYTRYLCVFLAQEPEMIGPVRSARPYLIYYALEYDGIFVHVGGSQDAFAELNRLSVADVDGLYSGAMWRYNDTGKYAPHNVYTDLKSIRDEAEKYGYRTEAEFDGYSFAASDRKLSSEYKESQIAEKIDISYNRENTSSYTYDKEKKLYLRFKDGEKHTDELTGAQLTTKNILVLNMTKQVLDSDGRLALGSVGSGEGCYISDGEAIGITWQKKAEKSSTKFYSGEAEISLNPGNTWVQVVSPATVIEFSKLDEIDERPGEE